MKAALHELMRRCREDNHTPTYRDLLDIDGQLVQDAPVAWRNSKTLSLHEAICDVQLADGDEFAGPLYAHPQPERKPLDSDALILLLADVLGFGDEEFQDVNRHDLINVIRAVERAHGIGGDL